MSDADAVDNQIKEAIWTYGGWTVLLGLTLAAGVTLGYIFWGDAIQLRVQNQELAQKIRNATQEKENFSLQLVNAQEETRRCMRKLNGEEGPSR